MDELVRLLQGYLTSAIGLGGCAEWLAGVDWDDPDLTREEKDSLGQFELLSTEIAEGLREESEFREAAANFIAAKTGNVSLYGLETEFSSLADQWRRETGKLSSVPRMAMHPAYQRIIGMGEKVVPLILREMETRPGHWFWALNAITGDNPVPAEAAGNLRQMTEAWLRWGKEKKLIS